MTQLYYSIIGKDQKQLSSTNVKNLLPFFFQNINLYMWLGNNLIGENLYTSVRWLIKNEK